MAICPSIHKSYSRQCMHWCIHYISRLDYCNSYLRMNTYTSECLFLAGSATVYVFSSSLPSPWLWGFGIWLWGALPAGTLPMPQPGQMAALGASPIPRQRQMVVMALAHLSASDPGWVILPPCFSLVTFRH